MCARSADRRHRAGLGLLGIDISFAGFSVPKNPRSSIRTSGPKLTVADNFKWPLVDRQTSTARFYDFALLCLFLKNLTVVNGWWAYTQFFTPPLDVFSDVVVLGAYFQVANVDDGLNLRLSSLRLYVIQCGFPFPGFTSFLLDLCEYALDYGA